MRVFFDTHDLIDIGEEKLSSPLSKQLLDLLVEHDAEIILSSFLIEELTNTPQDYREKTIAGIKRISCLKHRWMISPLDLQGAELCSFAVGDLGQPRPPIHPFVDNWVDAHKSSLPGPIYEKYKGASLEELLEGYAQRRSEFALKPILEALKRQAMGSLREVGLTKGGGRAWMRGVLRQKLRRHVPEKTPAGIILPGSKFTAWADMLATWARFCEIPATRTFLEIYLLYLRDRCGRQETGDFFDMAHLATLPYVDAFTCDKTTFKYVDQLKRRLYDLDVRGLEGVQAFKTLPDFVEWVSKKDEPTPPDDD